MQHGTKILQALSLRGGHATQAQLAAEVGLAEDRLGPILAGLHHNGYLLRSFAPEGVGVTLTDDGRHWLAKNAGVPLPSSVPAQVQPARQVGPRPQQNQGTAQRPQAAPAPQSQSQSQQSAQPAQATQTADVRRRLGLGKPAAAPVAVAVAAPAPEPQPLPEAQPETRVEAQPAVPAAAEEPAAAKADARRPRRRKEPKEEIATDESGFVTHIKGKAIF